MVRRGFWRVLSGAPALPYRWVTLRTGPTDASHGPGSCIRGAPAAGQLASVLPRLGFSHEAHTSLSFSPAGTSRAGSGTASCVRPPTGQGRKPRQTALLGSHSALTGTPTEQEEPSKTSVCHHHPPPRPLSPPPTCSPSGHHQAASVCARSLARCLIPSRLD